VRRKYSDYQPINIFDTEIEMKKLTGTSLALTLALSCGATSAMASSFEDKDMAFAFDSGNTMEVATLSEQEMKETEGEWLPVWMGAVGGAANAISTRMNGGSWGQTAYSFGTGFSGGFFAAIPGGGAALQVGRAIVGAGMSLSPYPFSRYGY
jgi:hypothetical protein